MLETLREIASKLWSVGKLAVPGVAAYEFFTWLFSASIQLFRDYINSQFDKVWTLIFQQMQVLRVDLAPPQQFAQYVAKINVIVPLSEIWQFFLLYLGVASVVLGVKWIRNLIPGLA